MSTFNGEKYLKEQIDSIFQQSYQNIQIVVRDDGSIDNTINILNSYKSEKFNWYSGNNLGPAKSFMDLIFNSPSSDYYAFSDQDDFWYSTKIEAAVNELEKQNDKIPTLYYCRKRITDDKLQVLGNGQDMFYENLTFGFSLMKCTVAGCTMVMNDALVKLIKKYPVPKKFVMHDIWILLVALAFGKVISDNNIYMDYRQHDNNFYGALTNFKSVFLRRLKALSKHRYDRERSDMAREFLNTYNSILSPREKKYLTCLSNLNMKNKLICIFSSYFKGENFIHSFLLKILFLLGWI